MAEINHRSGQGDATLEAVLDSILVDLTALRTAVNAAVSTLNAATIAGTGYVAASALTTTT